MRNGPSQAKFSVSVFALLLAIVAPAEATDTQITKAPDTQVLRDKIANMDHALFDAFNTCDVEKFDAFSAEDMEFYHDQHGLTVGRETFVKSNKRRCEDLVQGLQLARRELVDGSLEVYQLNDYGAIEIGTHRFYVAEKIANKSNLQVSVNFYIFSIIKMEAGRLRVSSVMTIRNFLASTSPRGPASFTTRLFH